MAYFESTNIVDKDNNKISPATEESVVLLRRIAKLMESQAATDPQQRQRVTIDAGTLPTVSTVTAVTTVATVTAVTNIAALNGWNQQMFADPARAAYNTGIRRWLSFSQPQESINNDTCI